MKKIITLLLVSLSLTYCSPPDKEDPSLHTYHYMALYSGATEFVNTTDSETITIQFDVASQMIAISSKPSGGSSTSHSYVITNTVVEPNFQSLGYDYATYFMGPIGKAPTRIVLVHKLDTDSYYFGFFNLNEDIRYNPNKYILFTRTK